MTLPRRIQLVKLLKRHGLRGAERMREEEIREALRALRRASPANDPLGARDPPSSAAFAKKSEPAPPLSDDDDPYALPRFREPRLLLPDAERTFLRAICVKPRLVFFTWDVHRARRAHNDNRARLEVRWAEFIGDAPALDEVRRVTPQVALDVDLAAGGWYVPVPGERLAVSASLVDGHGTIAQSNVSLTPPARPAPPGPLWLATLPPALDRRALLARRLLRGEVPDAQLTRVGETDARDLLLQEEAPPASAVLFRLFSGPSSPSSGGSSSGGKR